jgi:hypothetical protein
METSMNGIDWVGVTTGALFVAIGLAYLLSRRFVAFALKWTPQGGMWSSWLGEKWAPILARTLFAFASIAAGVWVVYSAVYGY